MHIYDPWADVKKVLNEFNINMLDKINDGDTYDAIIVAVAHSEFLNIDFTRIKKPDGIIFDTKAFLDRDIVDGRL